MIGGGTIFDPLGLGNMFGEETSSFSGWPLHFIGWPWVSHASFSLSIWKHWECTWSLRPCPLCLIILCSTTNQVSLCMCGNEVYAHVVARGRHQLSCSITFLLITTRQGLPLYLLFLPPCSTGTARYVCSYLFFYGSAGDLNLGLGTCTANTLPLSCLSSSAFFFFFTFPYTEK